jgi:hypothetical protein
MATVIHIFKSYCSIFLFEFLELWNLPFGPNECRMRFEIYIEFYIPRASPIRALLAPALLPRLLRRSCQGHLEPSPAPSSSPLR